MSLSNLFLTYFFFFCIELNKLGQLKSDWLVTLCCKRYEKITLLVGVHKTSLRFLFLCSNHHDPEHHHSGILVTLWLGLRQAAQLHTDLPTFSLLSNDARAHKGREMLCCCPLSWTMWMESLSRSCSGYDDTGTSLLKFSGLPLFCTAE